MDEARPHALWRGVSRSRNRCYSVVGNTGNAVVLFEGIPIDASEELRHLIPIEVLIVLQPPDHYSWVDIEFFSELEDR